MNTVSHEQIQDISKNESVLLEKYTSPERPYSQKELLAIQNRLYWNLGISKKQYVYHTKCQHQYLVKHGGHKSRQMNKENSNVDIGNCSVCWKLRQTNPKELYHKALDFIFMYNEEFTEDNPRLTFYKISVERIYYSWLYSEDDSGEAHRRDRRRRGGDGERRGDGEDRGRNSRDN
jgi:hypothetical protein